MEHKTITDTTKTKSTMLTKNFLVKKSLLFFLALAFFSCAPRKDLVYYQNIDGMPSKEKTKSYEVTIQPDDLLMIIVSTEDPEIAMPFNLKTASIVLPNRQDIARGQETNQLYLVDSAGFIDFPVLGKLKIAGMNRTEVLKMLRDKITVYIKNPVINLRIMNFKISVQGEVGFPGIYPVNSERITLIEALAMAKDLTIYGVRKNILIIREVDGVKSYHRVDITQADFINSPYYYLAQNDVIYVEPNKNRINGAAIGTNAGIIISVTSLLITLITLIVK